MDYPRCQSCAQRIMPGFAGSEADGSDSAEYCKFCYVQGKFTDENMTLERMLELSIDNMTGSLGMPYETAVRLANEIIPGLKRWQQRT